MTDVLRELSTEDLQALRAGNLKAVSTEALQKLRAAQQSGAAPTQPTPSTAPLQPSGGATGAGPVPTPTPTPTNASTGSITAPLKLGREALKDEFANMPWYEQLIAGVGSAPMQAWQSVKQLAGQDVPESEIQDWRDVASTPGGMVGNVAGNVGMLAVPGAKAEKLLASAWKARPVLARTLAGMGLAGAENAALTPVLEGESRAANAAMGAGAAGAIGTAGRALGGVVTPSKEARKLMDQGIQPTVGQGGSGVLGKTLGYSEELAGAVPIVGSVVQRGRDRAAREAVDEAAKRGSPYGASAPLEEAVGRGSYFQRLEKQFDDAYDDILSGKLIPVDRLFNTRIRQDVTRIMAGASPEATRELEKNMVQFLPAIQGKVKGPAWKEVQSQIRRLRADEGRAAGMGDRDAKLLREAYDAIDTRLKNIRDMGLSKEEVRQLEAVDEAYAHAETLRKAASYADQDPKGISIENLLQAVESRTPQSAKIKGEGRFQDITEPARSVLASSRPQDALERRLANMTAAGALGATAGVTGNPWLLAPLGVGYIGATRPGAKVLMGNTKVQRMLADAVRGRSGTAGAILSGPVED